MALAGNKSAIGKIAISRSGKAENQTCPIREQIGIGVQVTHLRSCVQERRTAGPSASSGFPVRLRGVDRAHAAFLTESRIRGR
jgi:hypothetical protein